MDGNSDKTVVQGSDTQQQDLTADKDQTKPDMGGEPKEPTEPDAAQDGEQSKDSKQGRENVSMQDLLVEIAKLERKNNKLSSENAKLNKDLRDRMSEKEIADKDKAEAQAARDEEFASMKRQIQIHDFTENYMDLGYSKDLAKKAATAQADGDNETLLEIQKQAQEAERKAWEADFLKKRPELNAGVSTGKTITKEQFNAMGLAERTKLFRENKAEYDRLNAM